MEPIKREHKYFMGGFLTGFFVYMAIFILGMVIRFRMISG